MKIILPDYVENIIEKLSICGFPTYAVGGSIRDILMNKEPVDWDIATFAVPDEVVSVFPDKKIIKTGEKFGTVTIVEKEGVIEATTFRSEGNYTDGRHPDWVRFEKNIETDLSRRDFTINAIAYNSEKGLIDPYGGIKDIKNKILRSVGDPKERFLEDSLRMIRAVRFYASLSFELESKTQKEIKNLAEKIKNVSPERVNIELNQILMSENPSKGIKMLLDTTLLKQLIPETDIVFAHENDDKDFQKFIFCMLDNIPGVLHMRMAILFMKSPYLIKNNNDMKKIVCSMKRLCCSNELIRRVTMLTGSAENFSYSSDRLVIKKTIRSIGKENIRDLILLVESIAYCRDDKDQIRIIGDIKKTIEEILRNEEPIDIADLDIDGNDIKGLGFNEGIIVGEILEYLMVKVLREPDLNKKDLLIEIIKSKWNL